MALTSNKGVIFSGMRPTGMLHLGNHLGALQNWVALQQDYRCIYCAVDIHALTTLEGPSDIADLKPNIHDMILEHPGFLPALQFGQGFRVHAIPGAQGRQDLFAFALVQGQVFGPGVEP